MSGKLVIFITCGLIFVTACQTTAETPDTDRIGSKTDETGLLSEDSLDGHVTGEAMVEEMEIQVMESYPVQVEVWLRGNLPDPCTRLTEVLQEREDNTFNLFVLTQRDPNLMCIQVIEPYETTVDLEVRGLSAGEYTVSAKGALEAFILSSNN